MILRRLISARDGQKELSIEYDPLRRSWRVSQRKGGLLCVVSSERVFIKREEVGERKAKEVLQALKSYALERFPHTRHSLKAEGKYAYLALCKDCEDCESIEPEPFALARLFSLHAQEGYVIDFGRRKTVFAKVKEGLLESFRVVLRGGDYISNLLARSRNISLEEAEKLKKQEGMSLKEVEEAVKEILKLSGYELKGAVLLTGGGSRLRGLRSLFEETLELKYVEPELAVCLGACLREVLKNPYPDFKEKELTKEDIKKLTMSWSPAGIALLLSFFLMSRLYSTQALEEAQRTEFKKVFPKEPVVSLYKQVKAKVSSGEEYKLTKLFMKAGESLRPGMKIYRFEYAEGTLSIVGEAQEKTLQGLKLSSTKRTPAGNVEFEVKVR